MSDAITFRPMTEADLDAVTALLDPPLEPADETVGRVGTDDERHQLGAGGEDAVEHLVGDLVDVGPDDRDVAAHDAEDVADGTHAAARQPGLDGDRQRAVPGRRGGMGHREDVVVRGQRGVVHGDGGHHH